MWLEVDDQRVSREEIWGFGSMGRANQETCRDRGSTSGCLREGIVVRAGGVRGGDHVLASSSSSSSSSGPCRRVGRGWWRSGEDGGNRIRDGRHVERRLGATRPASNDERLGRSGLLRRQRPGRAILARRSN